MRLLGTLRPPRLLERWADLVDLSLRRFEGSSVAVEAIEAVGHGELVRLGTSSRTYIAEGLVCHNTVLKMSNKRAMIAAILNGTAASDIFTQDVEDAGTAAADVHDYAGGGYDGVPFEAGEQAASQPSKFGSDAKTGTWHAPAKWEEFGERLSREVGEAEAREWMGQLAEVYGFESVGAVVASKEVSREKKADLWRRLLRVLEALEGEAEVAIRPDARQVVRDAFAAAFDGLALEGPDWPLAGTEEEQARGRVSASPGGEAAEVAEAAPEGSSAAEAEWEAADDVPEDLPF
jgi:hypothetical protein